jgi:ABC-2 type transport system permease protein
MKKVLAIAWKDVKLRFSGPSEWLFFLILPIVFTMVLAGGTGEPADTRVRLGVVDEAASPFSTQLIEALERSTTVRPDVLSRSEADNEFSQRRVSAVLVIPPEFTLANLIGGPVQVELRQQPNNTDALVAFQAVTKEVDRISSLVKIANASVLAAEQVQPFASTADRQAYFDAALAAAQAEQSSAPARLAVTRGVTTDQIEYDPQANSSAGQIITWVFIPLLGIAGLYASERQQGTLRRILTTPTGSGTYQLGTILGQVSTALVQMLLLVGFGIAVLNLNWGQSPAALALILVSSALAAAALGTMIGAFVRSEGQANGLAWMLGMLMALLGGCWYPAELFPQFVRTASLVLPTTWAMQGMLNIVARGEGLAGVLLPAGVLLGMAALFFTVGASRFKFE